MPDAINNGDLTTIGIATASRALGIAPGATATWFGQPVAGTDALLAYTWGGDANLDGKINIDDYGRIDGNVGQSGSVFGWFNGDFNYDGKINIDDYGVIDGNIYRQGDPFTAASIGGAVAVPEPIGLAFLGVSALLVGRRRGSAAFRP